MVVINRQNPTSVVEANPNIAANIIRQNEANTALVKISPWIGSCVFGLVFCSYLVRLAAIAIATKIIMVAAISN